MTAIGAVPAELDRPPDLRWIATDRGTCLLEHRSELGDLFGISAGDVPDVRVASDEPQGRGARGSDPDRRIRLLDRLRIGDRVLEVVVAAVEVGPLLGPERLDDAQRFAQHPDAVFEPFDAVHRVLDLRPSRPDAELEPPARQMVDGDRHLGQDDRMPIGVAGDQAPEAHALGRLGHRRLQGPALVDDAPRTSVTDRGQVVEIPHVIETALVGDVPDGAQRLDGRVLARELDAEAQRVRHIDRLMKAKTPNADWMVVLLRETLGGHPEALDLALVLAHVGRLSVGRRLRLWNGRVPRYADDIAANFVAVEVKLDIRVGFH